MSSVVIAGDTSGSVTLAAPSVAGTTTLTLPATSGTILTTTGGVAPGTSGNVLTSDGTNWTSAAVGVPNGGYSLYYRLNTSVTGSDSATTQSIFGVGVTLASSTQYEFELDFILSRSAGTTSHNVTIGFGGTATLNNIGFGIRGSTSSGTFNTLNSMSGTNFGQAFSTLATIQTVTASVTASVGYTYTIKGTVSINSGGTFIPQYTLSAAPGGAYTTQIGSYFKLAKIGAAGANINIGSFA